ncbi:hypothetical protein JRO89_XS12G0052000 [Xanthoceras sorbifolium]|uniref:Uncharacterized protein n=1 Tax=Xanthoceras sorbifolium TaxID=99658 RepID=A0ABQ8HB79_9ROSI|nr:hypothetical protein JRO89_XS12G0052000 [Xanthoceras sorbifolium]
MSRYVPGLKACNAEVCRKSTSCGDLYWKAFLHCYNDSCCPGSEEETWVCRKRSDKGFTLYKRMSSTRKMGAVGLARISTAAA